MIIELFSSKIFSMKDYMLLEPWPDLTMLPHGPSHFTLGEAWL